MQMHWCTCRVNLSGQGYHIVKFEPSNPVSWPEVQVIMMIHGDENVTDVMPISISDAHPVREKERLIGKYGFPPVEACFPGRSFRMELMLGDNTELPKSDDFGAAISAEEEDAPAGGLEPPLAPPVMRPGRQRPPEVAKEA